MNRTDLQARFLPLFVKTAQERLGRIVKQLSADDTAQALAIASEFHALAGEACAIEFARIGELAINGERIAKGCAAAKASDELSECGVVVHELVIAIDALAQELNLPTSTH